MKKLTQAELKARQADGATVRTKKPASKSQPPAPKSDPATAAVVDALKRQAEVTKSIADTLGEGQMRLAQELQTVVRQNEERRDSAVKPIPYRFKLTRNRKGLIESIDVFPITED